MQIEKQYLTGSNQISAKIIEDSIFNGSRLTTFVLKFPRIVLAEFNTHRAISRNSASSRAIPYNKMLEKVIKEPFIPIAFQADHKGMQGTEYLKGWKKELSKFLWLRARDFAVAASWLLSKNSTTKQLCNRLLEPFLYHTVIATATDWENLFALRAHEAAEIHICDLAYKMLGAYNCSRPKELELGEYHLPFGDKMPEGLSLEEKIKVSVARCARVSYETFDGKINPKEDFKLFDRLSQMGHWSPFEHVAKPSLVGSTSGNFNENWEQLRKTFQGENKRDERVK